MAYLEKDDYSLWIETTNLDDILNQAALTSGRTGDQIRAESELVAEEEIRGYLSPKYLMDAEFSKDALLEPPARSRSIIRCMVIISLFNIHHSVNPRDIPEMREKDYNRCIEMLAAYREGELILTLPDIPDGGLKPDDTRVDRLQLTSHVKFISKPYTDPAAFKL